ncbi:MAG: Guanine deaminase [Candidatus Jorgensenbacteria bacterium GW2011_GWA1_48_11]|uniref:Guanine deaminase n=1 Tax=Candidatus Jorgensenbacteria bacterium GW2011_GWA1_48_11 TaxID=1618660 RepID=A0A0G1X9P8_9BACT|nr:MAG: Guanine deaminase [Candidatus Jorgensenbacteria bacterium GW2011_GWA1_48_11]KKW11804.1 MAG: Guanine deaminase [Candidatus Jorgensenbacteria bacterium GW2011_GWB1_49_9]
MDDKQFLQKAIEKSKESVAQGGFPVGAIIIRNGKILSFGLSNGKQFNDPTNHAEINAIRMACQKVRDRRLKDVILYSSLEPCLMCFAASTWATIPKIVYACGRNRVSKLHYEGNHDLMPINKAARQPIELIHLQELEEEALRVIEGWEKK